VFEAGRIEGYFVAVKGVRVFRVGDRAAPAGTAPGWTPRSMTLLVAMPGQSGCRMKPRRNLSEISDGMDLPKKVETVGQSVRRGFGFSPS
jgi:hypothetical protein